MVIKVSSNLGKNLLLSSALLLAPQALQAVQTGDTATINFSARLVESTVCEINSGNIINVSFGNVSIFKVDTGEFIQPIEYTINCNAASSENTVYMSFIGRTSLFDDSALGTNADGLGIKVLKDGSAIELNSAFIIADPLNPPKLEVQLIKDPSVDQLSEQPFTAGASLQVEYF